MGLSVYYRSVQPVDADLTEVIRDAARQASQGRSWLSCEPVRFHTADEDGHLVGASKPNFQPHPDDAASAATTGFPDGTTRDLLEVLCHLSREHGVDWEIGHDYSDGPIGQIRDGECDEDVAMQIEAFAELGDIMGQLGPGFEP